MTPPLRALVRDTIELTGAAAPELLEDDAPILRASALEPEPDDADDFYLVGLIGGKDVGKSALVNAIAGRNITASTSHGRGTEAAVAYVHTSRESAVRELLEKTVAGQYRIVSHDLPALRRQVLLDLPDIDSHYQTHLEVTRAVLMHLLYPVWIGSVEKYADRQPQQMLARVAAGNAPDNFIFCLNKADQIVPPATANDATALAPLQELRADYAQRIARTLNLGTPPRVYVIGATRPTLFELPELAGVLAQEKAPDVVRHSKELASNRQQQLLLTWIRRQDLAGRAGRVERLRQDAEEAAAVRLAPILLERAIPHLMNDPATRGVLAEEILTERVARWPLVNLVHTLLAPLFLLMRSVTSPHAGSVLDVGPMVDSALRGAGEPLADAVQGTFANLRQSQPLLAELYADNKLWESLPAETAASELSATLADTLRRQHSAARERLAPRGDWARAPFRWLLTIGALAWFPFLQPILEIVLAGGVVASWTGVAALVVQVLGVNYLLKSGAFLLLWFAILWLAIRWNTQRRVTRLLSRWTTTEDPDSSVNLNSQALQWLARLLDPLRRRAVELEALAQRADELERNMNAGITPKPPRRATARLAG